MKRLLYFIVVILLIALIVIGSYFIYKQLREEKEQESIFDDLHEIIQDNDENSSKDNLNANNDINLNELYNQNNDLIGWIKIDNTTIDYPVMQTKYNPEYYLKRNFYKEYSSYGTPFLAYYCNINTSDNLIIYGHNIKSGKMFADLDKYKEYDFYNTHTTIKLYKLQGTETIEEQYKVIFCFKTTVNNGGFKYYNFYNASSQDEFNSFVEQCSKLSLYNTDESVVYGDKLITLSTCEYSLNNGRMVVVAKKIF